VGASLVCSYPTVTGNIIRATCSQTIRLMRPIRYAELSTIRKSSPRLSQLLWMNMQRYLTEISEHDFRSIVALRPKDERRMLELLRGMG
jgi:hypothetical protein